ncbi:MAG: hypothetical protein AAF748_05745 [Pseudomonadota bacterium]
MKRAAAGCAALVAVLLPFAAAADLSLAACDRTTHISHGGETAHRDIGGGRVLYLNWWAQEGVYTDVVVADCAAGNRLIARLKEERIKPRPPFDRVEKGLAVLDAHLTISPALFSLEWVARALDGTGRDIAISALPSEPCACAVLYPEMRGDWAAFEGIEE